MAENKITWFSHACFSIETFPLLVQDADGFVSKAKELAPDVEVVVLNPGETYSV